VFGGNVPSGATFHSADYGAVNHVLHRD
jgi:hypothetical protein